MNDDDYAPGPVLKFRAGIWIFEYAVS